MVYYQGASPVKPVNSNFASYWRRFKRQLHENCACCYLPSLGHGYLCQHCQAELSRNTQHCPLCAVPIENLLAVQTPCGNCQHRAPYFDLAISPFVYNHSIKPLIEQVKANETGAIKFSAHCLFETLNTLDKVNMAIFMPIPMSSQKLKHRHCNPSQLMTQELLKLIQKQGHWQNCQQQHFIQKKDYPAQKGLNLKQRRKNVKHAFELTDKSKTAITGKIVFIIDDIMTSGSTLNEAARIIKPLKPNKIIVVSLARTPKNS